MNTGRGSTRERFSAREKQNFTIKVTDQTRQDHFLNVIDPSNSKEEVPFGRPIPGLATTLGFSAACPELRLMEGPTWSLGQNLQAPRQALLQVRRQVSTSLLHAHQACRPRVSIHEERRPAQ
jgi:hypothetical protein